MAITAALCESTPYRLRYLCSQDGVISSPPSVNDGLVQINALAGATPDLVTDTATSYTLPGRDGPSPLRAAVRAGQDGYGPLPAGAKTQAQARAILNSDDPGNGILGNDLVSRCVLDINGRLGAIGWAIDATVDGGFQFPAVQVQSEVGVVADAYLDIECRDSFDL